MSRHMIGKRLLLLGGLCLLVLLLSGVSLMAGRVWVPWSAWSQAAHDPRWAIIFELRLPRTILAIAVGAALGLSGAVMQGYTRNPLADPGVLGVTSMAALGAVMTMYLSLSLAPSPWAAQEIVNWLLGSLADRSADDVWRALPFILVGSGLLLMLGRALNALTLGETGAKALGVDLNLTRVILAVGVGLASGASVAVTGMIGFVGLIVPHLMRPLVGHQPGALLAPSAVAGAVLVLAADILVRLTPSAAEVRLGVAMSAIGGPFFLALLISMRRRLA